MPEQVISSSVNGKPKKSTPFLRDIWYYALPGKQLKAGSMIAKTLLGEPVLLGRSLDGQVFALRDICPHRSMPLTCGRFDGREIECCYHGWRFAPTGSCTAIPSLTEDQALDLKRFQVKQYPVHEVQGNIWIYMASTWSTDANPDPIDIPSIPYFSDQSYQLVETLQFPCFIDHAISGLIDPAHSLFVHRVWWWRLGRSPAEEVKQFDPSPYGFTMRRHKVSEIGRAYWLIGGVPEIEITFRLPGVRIESITTEHHTLCNLTVVTPISETESELNFVVYWTTPWLSVLKPFLRPSVRQFLNQDRAAVAKQQIGLKHNPTPILIEDADTQVRWYYQLKAEFSRAMAEGRPFINPVKEQVLRYRA